MLPLAFVAGLAAIAWIPPVRAQEPLVASIVGAALALAAGIAALGLRSRGRTFIVEFAPRPQHYLQACAQATVLAYWGWYWRPVYEAVPLIAAQLAFAYAFDILLTWFRRDRYTLGAGPFPVIFSINLFLWFKPEWFWLQFVMIAVGLLAKELIRWTRDGRRVHIFNPSSFPLAVFSIGLILTGTTSMTWGPEIARTQFNAPGIYLVLFLVALPGQFLFGVTTMTMSAVVTTYLFGLAYVAATGSYFFIDSYIPVAVFLGMHLLFTDPSTSPRTELGRILFGVIYGLSVIALYEALAQLGLPRFYDKLLPVPLMNLSVRAIDAAVRSPWLARLDPSGLAPSWSPRQRHLAYIVVWTMVFGGMSAVEGVGDDHPGRHVPVWEKACAQDARHACTNLGLLLSNKCQENSPWACNELGVLEWSGRVAAADGGAGSFTRACALGMPAGCANTAMVKAGGGKLVQPPPQIFDYPILLRVKRPVTEVDPMDLWARACREGWSSGCEDLGGAYLQGVMTSRDPRQAAALFEQACTMGRGTACSNLGLMHYQADGLPRDEARGLEYLERACALGFENACVWRKEIGVPHPDATAH